MLHNAFLEHPGTHGNHLNPPIFNNNMRKAESFTNRLLYQLSYVGLTVIFSV